MSSKTTNLELNINYQSPQKQVDMKYGYDENFQILDESIQYILGTLENTDVAFSESIDLNDGYLSNYYLLSYEPEVPDYFYGQNIWYGKNHIYFSGHKEYVYDSKTSSWINQTWHGLDKISPVYIWKCKDLIFYSQSNNFNYVLQEDTSTWEPIVIPNMPNNFYNTHIWYDGDNTYYSYNTTQLKFNYDTLQWENITWNNITYLHGEGIWQHDNTIYYSYSNTHRKLNRETATWEYTNWNGMSKFYGSFVWTFDNTVFYSSIEEETGSGSKQYILNPNSKTWLIYTWNDNITFDKHDVWYNENEGYVASFSYSHDGYYKILK